MKKETLGGRLKAAQAGIRRMRWNEVYRTTDDAPAFNVTAADHKRVAALFASARRRTAAVIRLGAPAVSIRLGRDGAGAGEATRQLALRLLKQACWPMTVPEGIQLPENAFHRHWQDLVAWAVAEELVVSLHEDYSKDVAAVDYRLAISPR